MDSITHIAIGACIGEAFFAKNLGRKALLIGAIAQSIPDFDFVCSFWMDTSSFLLVHRGLSHSILFCFILIPFFTFLSKRIFLNSGITSNYWLIFFGISFFTHILLDAFNNYGVGWFEPFSNTRISFNAIYVLDPFFSFLPFIAFLCLLLFKFSFSLRKLIWKFIFIYCIFYLSYCLYNKSLINLEVKKTLQSKNIKYKTFFNTPTPFQSWLWYIVVKSDSGYFIGYQSVFDKNKQIIFSYFPNNHHLLKSLQSTAELTHLICFSNDYYTIEKNNNYFIFNILRFGQILGWQQQSNKFVFYYILNKPNSNRMVVQRGRFVGWNKKSLNVYIDRITGNK